MKTNIITKLIQLFKPNKDWQSEPTNKDAISTINGIEITYESEAFRIESLGSIYFSIQGISQEKLVELLQFENIRKLNAKDATDYLYKDEDFGKKKTDSSAMKAYVTCELNGWVYLKWKSGIFEDNKYLIEYLMKYTTGVIAYFYVDPYVDGYEWIIAQNNNIIRAFKYDMGNLYIDEGKPVCYEEIEFLRLREKEKEKSFEEWIRTRENPFVSCEEVYAGVVKNTSQHIEELNKDLSSLGDFYVGTVNLKKLQGTTSNS